MNKSRKLSLLVTLFILGDVVVLFAIFGRPVWQPIMTKLTGGRTVQQALDQYGPSAQRQLLTYFDASDVDYPPKQLTLIGLKEEKVLEVWARDDDTDWTRIHTYPILAASGAAGPKQREGDKQVPEGIYTIESLNPNSSYHLSIKLNYPNAFDLERAKEDGRDNPGSNIFIHGKAASVGCLAMGDPAIEELFVLTEITGIKNTKVILLPHDPAKMPLEPKKTMPPWTAALYRELERTVQPFRSPE